MFLRCLNVFVLALLLLFAVPRPAGALGFQGLGVKAGINLTREQSVSQIQGVGGSFDKARVVFGSQLNLGSMFLPKLHFVPGADVILEGDLRVFSANTEFWYFFHENSKYRGYAGGGFGVHFYRFDDNLFNQTKVTLNVPLGFQRKLGGGAAWFGEMKLVIADDESDSSLQFNVGFAFGGE